MEVWLSAGFPGVQNQGLERTQHNSSWAWLQLLLLIPFPNSWVMGDKPVLSTVPWLSFCKGEGNQEKDKVLHGL